MIERPNHQRILIVDDEPYNIIALKIIVEACYKKILNEMKKLANFDARLELKSITNLIDDASNGEEAFNLVK